MKGNQWEETLLQFKSIKGHSSPLCDLDTVVCHRTSFVNTSAHLCTYQLHTFIFHRQEKHAMYHMKQMQFQMSDSTLTYGLRQCTSEANYYIEKERSKIIKMDSAWTPGWEHSVRKSIVVIRANVLGGHLSYYCSLTEVHKAVRVVFRRWWIMLVLLFYGSSNLWWTSWRERYTAWI